MDHLRLPRVAKDRTDDVLMCLPFDLEFFRVVGSLALLRHNPFAWRREAYGSVNNWIDNSVRCQFDMTVEL